MSGIPRQASPAVAGRSTEGFGVIATEGKSLVVGKTVAPRARRIMVTEVHPMLDCSLHCHEHRYPACDHFHTNGFVDLGGQE